MPAAVMTKRRSAPITNFKQIGDGSDGVFEAIVSVFGNVDYANDRVVAGAFGKNLEEWSASGDPIPIIWSHNWVDWRDHIGVVLEAAELMPGDSRLPAELMSNGGLWIKGQLDMEEQEGRRIFKLLVQRRVKEFSFAYDVESERRSSDGVNDLIELKIHEVGPTLKGMNPDTVLLSQKNIEALAQASGVSTDSVRAVLTASIGEDLSREGSEMEKKSVTFAGSVEERQAAIYRMAVDWAVANNIGNGGIYAVYLEATYDDRAIILVEGWDDPVGEGIYFEAVIGESADGFTMEDPVEVVVEGITRPKSRAKGLSSPARKDALGIVAGSGDDVAKSSGKAEDPEAGKAEDQGTRSESESGNTGEVERLQVELDALAAIR